MKKVKEVLQYTDKMHSTSFECESLSDLNVVAKRILDMCPDEKVFAFYGVMGVGKTTLIKSLCKFLNVNGSACSPSFGIVHHYQTNEGESVFHFDFYRIKKMEEAFDIGYEEYFFSGNYCFIEWPERIEELLPGNCVKVYLEESDGKRIISFSEKNIKK